MKSEISLDKKNVEGGSYMFFLLFSIILKTTYFHDYKSMWTGRYVKLSNP